MAGGVGNGMGVRVFGGGGKGTGVEVDIGVSVGLGVCCRTATGVFAEEGRLRRLGTKMRNATKAMTLARIHRMVSRLGKREEKRSTMSMNRTN